jgi:glycosyltransferase involved in cell wall biosynthesis
MRILVDGYWWYEGPYSNRMVMREIVRQWRLDFPGDELIVAAPRYHRRKAEPILWPDLEIVDTHLPLQLTINTFELPVIARRCSADSILAFNFASPLKRGVVLILDVLFQSNPEWFTPLERAYFAGMPTLAPQAKSVITISDSERNRIVKHNPKLKRVVSCGLAVATSLTEAESTKPELGLTPGAFAVCVGRFNERKNLGTTVKAVLKSGVLSPDFPLVLVGDAEGAPDDISDLMASAPTASILTARQLTDGEIRWLYENCRFSICLSLDEGFGLPAVEAAYFGSPIIVSDIPVFRENLGAYGIFVDPRDVESISSAVKHFVDVPPASVVYGERHSWSSVCHCIRSEMEEAR